MSYRMFGYVDKYSVNVLNSVPIVFHDDDKVIGYFNNYINSLDIRKEDVSIKKRKLKITKQKCWKQWQNP